MKNFLILISILFTGVVFGQSGYLNGKQPFQKPKEGKSLVYLIRSGAGALVNFRAYKDDKFLGALVNDDYLIIECEPGEHLFWAVSENRDYVEANLEANKVYVLNIQGQMGAFIASVSLKQLDPNKKSDKKLFARKIRNSWAIVYDESRITEDKSENIEKGLAKYKELKAKESSKIIKLDPAKAFENADKPN
ncbi:hypothetical protein [Flavobacterium lindanitolerans]|uniref:hypothetical protein n=1 Tax=Flavobacterium lindanitolerans TaxID=428988 RepID=UPI0028083E2D|nr:hypothetical protein [Flavobacterium lindanitolerans]MDQ7960222.1 hypothetical protein [Flavobacterium lindanitolerans]